MKTENKTRTIQATPELHNYTRSGTQIPIYSNFIPERVRFRDFSSLLYPIGYNRYYGKFSRIYQKKAKAIQAHPREISGTSRGRTSLRTRT